MEIPEVEQQIANEFPPATATLSCFYYTGSGERCGAPSPPGSLYCGTHITRMYRIPLQNLQNQAAEALVKCTSFTESGLITISCREIDSWGELSNSLAALVLHGYRREEECMDLMLSSLLSNSSFRKAVSSKLPPKWKAFETLVARLHVQQLSPLMEAVAQGKQLGQMFAFRVFWNLHKRGRRTGQDRQIDVAIIATLGLQEIFIAVECKDAKVEIGDVEAFYSKLNDLGAQKGVIATSVGFQEGAKRAADAYNIDTFHITQDIPIQTTVTRRVSYLRPEVVGVFCEPPTEVQPKPMEPDLRAMGIKYPNGKQMSLAEVVREILESDEPQLYSWPPLIERAMPTGTVLVSRTEQLPTAKVCLIVKFRPIAQQVTLPLPDRPVAFSLRNILSGFETKIRAADVPLTVPRLVETGRFYINLTCQCYYCEKIVDDLVTFLLLEDKQHGTLLSASLTGDKKYSVNYFPMEDEALLGKLRESLQRYRKA